MFKLFSPRLVHLRYCLTHPPTWLAWFFGIVIVAVVDLSVRLDPNGYQAKLWEWLAYAGGAFIVIAVYRALTLPSSDDDTATATAANLKLQNIADADWSEIEAWLQSDAPAEYDFLGNRIVAERLTTLLMSGTRSIGIVGPFGAGKTSIIKWMCDEIDARNSKKRRLFVSEHSCWGFENSASAIHEMLSGAIRRVESEIDTFQVSSLPESYRQTFSAGGEWIDSISNLVLGKREPSEQFERLSQLLCDINAKLVIVVEDLDRNESRSFDIQEVLAFLYQLKEYKGLAFVLTGGVNSSRQIDFAKLCNHIEYLKTVQTKDSSNMITRVCERCNDTAVFPHVHLRDPERDHVWHPSIGVLMRDYEELSLPQAVASLLNNPRSLRHALGRTWTSWRTLCGEIDLNHLIAVNVLRFGAPEAFLFLVRRWDRLHSAPSKNPHFGQERLDLIKKAIIDDWNRTIKNVEWNPAAALTVIEHILPTSENWFGEGTGGATRPIQGVELERYWRRAVNESLDAGEVRDQEVICDLKDWCESKSSKAKLLERLCTSEDYSRVWELLASTYIGNKPDDILLLTKQVIEKTCRENGNSASIDSQGVRSVCSFASHYAVLNGDNKTWLMDRISDSSVCSLRMAVDLWHTLGSGWSFLQGHEKAEVRKHLLDTIRNQIVDSNVLNGLLDPTYPYVLYQAVFDFGKQTLPLPEVISSWNWLSPILIDALKNGNASVAAAVAVLISTRESGTRSEPWSADPAILDGFFGSQSADVVDMLANLSGAVTHEKALVESIVKSARQVIEDTATPKEDSPENAD